MSEPKGVILVAEDEVLVRMNAADILQDAGYHVCEARDGLEALAILETRGDVGALFTDVAMPNMNGVMLARIVHQRWPEVGIVATTGAMPGGLALELPESAPFLPKPYSQTGLLQAIQAVLPRLGGPITIKGTLALRPGREFGAGGMAQPLPEPEKE